MYWFLTDAARLERERAAIADLLQAAPWLATADWKLDRADLVVEADIVAHGAEFRVILRYPKLFPSTPPSISPRDPGEPRWSTHQYVGGELCLELGADTWSPEMTGAQMLESAHRLFQLEAPLSPASERLPAPSRHELTTGQELRSEPFRFVTTASLRDHVKTLSDGVYDATLVYAVEQEESYTLFVSQLQAADVVWKDAAVPAQLTKFARERTACVVRLSDWVLAPVPGTMDELFGKVNPETREQLRIRIAEISATHLLVVDHTNNIHMMFLPTETRGAFYVPEIEAHEDLAGARLGVTAVEATVTVGIVGLGSAGSKIAVSLARSGVRNFVLVDDDILLPENIVRNDLDWRSVGQHKVDAVANRLRLIVPDAQVAVRRIRLGGQESNSTSASALDRLAACNVIVDATADPTVFNLLGAVAEKAKRVLVWLEIFAGGFGGLVARYRSGIDSPPPYMRQAFHAFCEGTSEPPKTATGYGATGVDGGIQIATDAEVTIVAEHATRLALDSAINAEPSIFPYSMYLVGLRREWVFKAPFEVIPIDLSNVAVPERPGESAEELNAGLAFVQTLIDAIPND